MVNIMVIIGSISRYETHGFDCSESEQAMGEAKKSICLLTPHKEFNQFFTSELQEILGNGVKNNTSFSIRSKKCPNIRGKHFLIENRPIIGMTSEHNATI